MKKIILTLALSLVANGSLTAAWCDSESSVGCGIKTDWPSPFNAEIGVGYRQDKFKFGIASGESEGSSSGSSSDESVLLSELRWRDLRMVQVEGCASWVSCSNYAVRISGDYGHIYHGHNSDTDYDTRTGEPFSISRNNAGKGNVYDIDGAVGYRVTSTCARFIGIFLAGWSQHAINLHLFDGKQVLSRDFLELGPITGLNSHYNTRWFGPWLGMEFTARVERCAYVFGSFEWHWLSYRANGRMNLREDIGPFHHSAHGFGWRASLGGSWEIWENFSLGVLGTYRNFKTRHGREHIEINDPVEGTFVGRSRFAGAKWHGLSVSGIIGYRF